MFEDRSLKLDLVALALLALCVFLGLSLATYSPADPPSSLVYPSKATINNACGRSGAIAADLLLNGLGIGAFYFLISLAALDTLLLARKPITQPVLRALGWILSLVGFTAFASMMFARFSPGPVIGAGGYLGAAGRGWLEMHFANAGALVLTISLIAGGLLLCTDYVVFRMLFQVLAMPLVGAGAVRKVAATAAAKKKAAKEAKKDDIDTSELAVKISGKAAIDESAKAGEADDEEEETEEEESTEEKADGEESSTDEVGKKKGVAERLASALRIKPPTKSAREQVMKELDEAVNRVEDPREYKLPSIDLLQEGEEVCFEEHEKDVRRKAKILEKTFLNFGFKVKVVEIETGPVIAQFEVELEAGLRLSKITSLADDLAIALRVPSVRIVAPIPGKNTVGIEIPNAERQLVRIREVIEESTTKAQKMRIPIFLGKDVSGKPMVVDLTSLPHLLIAGRTGTGKSVCLNSIIVSMLMSRKPEEVKMLMIDPKMVELSCYKTLPHLMHPVVTDMRKAEAILAWAVDKMEERYALLARAGVRHIGVYNQLGEEELMERLQPESDEEHESIPRNLPYIVIVADEIADMMMTAGKEVEQHIIRLAQKSRAVGIHLILATQKPTVDVITGLIKSNLPARIAFQVASRTDSRVVLDEMGADKLLGNGDMLFLWPGTSTLLRGQGTYVSDDEINKIVEVAGQTEQEFVKELVHLKTAEPAGEAGGKLPNRDELYEQAVDLVVREGRGSCSLLQRALGIGYGRAARLVDFMAEDGIVGQYNGSQAREVLMTVEKWESMGGGSGGAAEAPSKPSRASAPAKPVKPAKPAKPPIQEFEEDSVEDEADELYDEADYEEDEYEEDDDESDDDDARPGRYKAESA